jgi:chromosome segregation ATPase
MTDAPSGSQPEPDAESRNVVVVSVEDNHPAAFILAQLLEAGQIPSETYSTLLFKFQKLHQAFTQSCATEQTLLRRTRDLNKELKAQKMTIQNSASQQQEHRQALSTLRQYVTNIQAELESTRDQIESTQANTLLKNKEYEKLKDKVDKASDDKRNKMQPQVEQMNRENAALEAAIAQYQQTINGLRQNAQRITDRIGQCDHAIGDIERQKRSADQRMVEISSMPIRTRQKANAVESSHNSMLSEEKSINNQLSAAEANMQRLQQQAHDLEAEYQHITNDIDGMEQAVSDVKGKTEELRQRCGEQSNVKQQYEYESRRIGKLVAEQIREIGALDVRLEQMGKDAKRRELECQKLEEAIAKTRLETNTNNSKLLLLKADEVKEQAQNVNWRRERDKALEDKEAAAQAILSVQEVNQQVLSEIRLALTEKDRKQSIHDELAKKERDLLLDLTEASLIRDRKAREMTGMKKKIIDCKTLAMERNLDFLDLCGKVDQNSEKLRELSELYERVKLDRNKNMNHIQTSRQLIVEYNEKIRILENEVEVLRLEFEQVCDVVRLQKNELASAFKRRDQTRSDLKTAELHYVELQNKIDFQDSEIRQMNRVLTGIEDAVILNQRLYEDQSVDCSNIQKMLIDRRDELSLITEQFNRHEWVMKRGEVQLREREEELKLLRLQLNDFARQIEIMQRKLPQLRAYDRELAELDKQLEVAHRESEQMTAKLEAPDLHERQRAYRGKDFTLKELEDKVSMYEQRINSKGQQLWEKQILLHEIDEKIAQITHLSGSDDQKTLKAFERSGALRAEAMTLRRRKMAALAETAVYRAQSTDLQDEKQAVKDEIVRATERSEQGDAFDVYATKIMKMHQRDVAAASRGQSGEFDEDEDEDQRPGRPHFDAYPTADGLSRPYGAFPVFQPAPPSGQLRHYRKETQRPIEL